MKLLGTLKALLIRKDPLARFELLRRLAKRLVPEYRFKWPQMAWWQDPLFNDYLAKFGEADGMNTDRRWMLYQLLRLVRSVPGDTAECGVFTGAGSYLICMRNQQAELMQRTHHVFDSFEGLSAPSAHDGAHWAAGDLSCALETVQRNLSAFSDTEYHKGWIPERFPEIEEKRFCFVHVDVDLYEPTLASLEFFYPRMNQGGLIVCDDYGFTSCPGATKAVDEYLEDKAEKMLALSGGGGFLMKGIATSDPLGR